MDDPPFFGPMLRERRKACDLTQEQLAEQVHYSVETIKKIEAGKLRPSRPLAVLLADTLAIPAEERAAFLKAARAEPRPSGLGQPPQLMEQAVGEKGASALAATTKRSPVEGTVTFLFSDIEGSTQLWEQHPQEMPAALARHDALLRETIEAHGGVIFKTAGDGVCAAFARASDALVAALATQRALNVEDWGSTGPVRVCMALHTGITEERDDDYFGPPLNRVARLLAAGHGGQVLLSRATQELVYDHVPPDVALRDLGTHRLKDLTRPERIFQLVAPDLPTDFPVLKTLDARPSNLPVQLTPLIGRERDVAGVGRLLRQPNARLVTLTGPGGVGKTRLALQVAADILDDFADGVSFINLAPISDPHLVIPTIAQTLGVKEGGGYPLIENLKDYLRERQLLLLLDNFEQVLSAAPQIAELLAAAPNLKVLVTSREVLHLRGEKEFPVPPLALPALQGPAPIKALSQYAAVQLFIARALDVKPDFAVTNENAPAVAEICVRLDGLPLAIELAAARVKLFAPETLLARLGNRLALLTGGPRDLPARQQTLRNTIAWSYNLLDEGEKRLFARLSVFVGGWTLEAAEAVCRLQGTGYREQEKDVDTQSLSPMPCNLSPLDGLASLMDKSLLRQVESQDGETRFVMLETIREYALEQLAESNETEVQQRHAAYYLALAEASEPALQGAQQAVWLARLEAEHNNIRAALTWVLAEREVDLSLRFAGTLSRFWHMHGHVSEGRRLLAAALALVGDEERARTGSVEDAQQPPEWGAALAKALNRAGYLAILQTDYAAADLLLHKSLILSRTLGDTLLIASVLNNLGIVSHYRGDYAAARALYEESLALNRELGEKGEITTMLTNLGMIAMEQGDYAAGRALHEESLTLSCELGDEYSIAWSLIALGQVAWYQGDYATAQARSQESLVLRRKLNNKQGIAESLVLLGKVARIQGDYATAQAHLHESLVLVRELGDKRALAIGIEEVAALASVCGQAERALRLAAAAASLREAIGHPLASMEQAELDSWLVPARQALSEATYTAAWETGQAMTLEQTIAVVLDEGS